MREKRRSEAFVTKVLHSGRTDYYVQGRQCAGTKMRKTPKGKATG